MKFFIHTSKAVRRAGAPADRLLIVQNEFKEGRRTWYNAWNGRLTPQGLFHPGISGVLPINEITLAQLENMPDVAKNGAEPTAQFYKDSFYHEVTWADVHSLYEKQRIASTGQATPVTHLEYVVHLRVPDGEEMSKTKLVAIRRLMTKLHKELEAL